MSHPQGIQQYGYAHPSAYPPQPWQGHERDPYDTYRASYEPHWDRGAQEAHGSQEAYGTHGAYEAYDPYGPYGLHGLHEPYGAHEPYAPHQPYHPYQPWPPEEFGPADPLPPSVPPHSFAPPQPAEPPQPPGLPGFWLPHQPTGDRTVPSPATGPRPSGGRAAARRAARARKAAQRPEALRRLLPQALVVACLAGGTSAFVTSDKAVRLTVEGRGTRTLHTFADDVAELLADEGVRVGAHDAVSPAPDRALSHGDRVFVRFGRPLALTLDGRSRRVWTTARTVEEALRRIGVRPEGAYVSVPRDRRLDRGGLTLTVRTERSVTFLADGRERTVRTNAATVREALADAGVELRGQDTTSVPPDSFPRDGQTVAVLRITDTEQALQEPVPYSTVRREDPTLLRGTEVVAQPGSQGVRRLTYRVRTVNGVPQRPRHVRTELVRAPVPRIVRVGTRELPVPVRGADGLDWEALARCESGGRPDAVDSTGTHGGLYQFDTRTWRSVGGTGRPQDASPAEQTYRAKRLYVRKGASPWPGCGRKLHR
ncbi:MAG TPA: ubiquitin-like domain-containing protein [Streptomyces sp.]|nr:ubiquitin-like domain-containing protein [Streptomyces sp.]